MFLHSISDLEIARQIAQLINTHNGLTQKRRAADILESKIPYVVETHGQYVVGAVAISKVTHVLTEIKHLVVRPAWQGQGVGKFLVKRAIPLCKTEVLYAQIREGNVPSEKLFESLGFRKVEEYTSGDHLVGIFLRKVKECLPKSKLVMVTEQTV